MFAVAYQILKSWKREDGQTMAEYGVILAVIAVIAVGAFAALGGNISTAVSSVADSLNL